MENEKRSLIEHDAVAIFGTEALNWEPRERFEKLAAFWNDFWRRDGREGEHPIVQIYDAD